MAERRKRVEVDPGPQESPGGESLPSSMDTERALLGAMLLSRDAVAAAVEVTSAEAFWRPAHAAVFEAIADLYGAGEPTDAMTVAHEVDKAGLLAAVGGLAGLLSLQAGTPSTTSAASYARIVDGLWLRRRIMDVGRLLHEVGRDVDDAAAALDAAESAVMAVRDRRPGAAAAVTLYDALTAWLDEVEPEMQEGRPAGVETGLHRLDAKLAGLRAGQLIVVGGRPGQGKSDVAVHVARNVAGDGSGVVFASVEMNVGEVVERFLAQEGKVPKDHLRRRALTDVDYQRMSRAMARLGEGGVHIVDDPALTMSTLRSAVRRAERAFDGRLGLIVVDYVQLMASDRRGENRQVEVAELSRGLKVLARVANCAVVALSQLSRQVELRADKRPMLSDLRESGGLEADADAVVFVYRDEVYDPRTERPGIMELIVAKQRNGPTGTVRVRYDAETGRLHDPPPKDAAEPLSMDYGEAAG